MTIKELEERTGMTRANIRYYEDEKLLTPQRLPNGYRDYSEEDVETLEKIKLLRQLHLDIDTIRLVQQGQLTLEQALFSQLNRLEHDKRTIDRALEVSRRIERSGVEYGALDPKFWLEELKRPAHVRVEGKTAPMPPKEEATDVQKWFWAHRAYNHPWMRYFARAIDILINGMVIDLLGWLVIPNYILIDPPGLVDWFLALCLLAFTLLVEPLWLHFWGYTPGKWIFGLKLRDEKGEKLSLRQGYERSFRVLVEGYGWNIPFYNWYRLWKGRRCCVDLEDCPWDAEEGYLYGREERRLYGLYVAAAYVVCFALAVLLAVESFLPRHHSDGGLTVKQFCQNYNYALQLYKLDDYYDPLTKNGKWDTEDGPGYVTWPEPGETVWHDPEFTVEDGLVTAVTLTMESDRHYDNLRWNMNREQVALLALSGSLDVDLFNYDPEGWLQVWDENNAEYWGDYQFDFRGLRITIDTEAEGYDGFGYSDTLAPIGGAEHHVTRTVTISLIGSEG